MNLNQLINRCQKELYLGFTSVELSGVNWLNVSQCCMQTLKKFNLEDVVQIFIGWSEQRT